MIHQEPSDLLQPFLDRLDRPQERNGYWQARCPAHDDREPSLSVQVHDDGLGIKCHTGCSSRDILDALGLGWDALYPPKPSATLNTNGHRKPTTAPVIGETRTGDTAKYYEYQDDDGEPLFRVERTADKRFLQQRWDGSAGKYIYGLDGLQPVLYRLPEIMRADQGEPVFVVEGEKDADRLARAGLVATTSPMGAGKWRAYYADALEGRKVYVLADNDDTGEEHAQQVAASVPGARIVRLPGLPKKGDVSDWLDDGNTIEQLLELARSTPEEPDEPPQAGRRYEHTDAGNGERFRDQHGDLVRWCPTLKKWLVYNGKRWATDDRGAVVKLATGTARSIFADAADEPDTSEQQKIVRWAKRSQSKQGVEATLFFAKHDLSVTMDELDLDPWVFNCQNGTLDLRTDQLRDHDPADLITKIAPVAYDPAATCPRFDDFLAETLVYDDVARFVQRFAGYSLTGSTRERAFVMLWGRGKNGKSTLVELVQEMLGDYGTNTDVETILMQHQRGVNNDVAALRGARFVSTAEVEQGRRLAESKLKALTGSDTVTARFLYGEPFSFRPEFKLWISTNNKPVIEGTDEAIWDRVRLVPFTQRFDGRKADPELPAKLRDEFAGVLAWAVRGCLDWQQHGLGEPEAVVEAVQEYRVESDMLAAFFEDRCVIRPELTAPATELYHEYRRWSLTAGEDPETQRVFGSWLRERGFTSKRLTSGVNKGQKAWGGIGLLVNHPGPDDGHGYGRRPGSEPLSGSPEGRGVNKGSPQQSGLGIGNAPNTNDAVNLVNLRSVNFEAVQPREDSLSNFGSLGSLGSPPDPEPVDKKRWT